MPLFNSNKPSEDNKEESKPDTNMQPSFVPKRVIHPAKSLSPTGEGNRRLPSIFRRKPTLPPEIPSQPGDVKPEGFPKQGDRTVPARTDKSINPGLRLRAFVTAGKNDPPLKPQKKSHLFTRGERSNPAFWYVVAGSSLIINVILVVIMLTMGVQINNLKTTLNGLLSGLYGSFVEMDKASITTTITLDTQIPLNFTLPIQQNTDVTLIDSVTIPNANIVINSGGFNINAPARVTLPAGTNLPIALNLAVPVQISIPVTLQIPVNIPLAQTELHQPITSLQNTIRSYYCTLDKNAEYPKGIYICEDHDVPSSTPGVP